MYKYDNNTGCPHFLKVEFSYETFYELKWCKVKKQILLTYKENLLVFQGPPKITYQIHLIASSFTQLLTGTLQSYGGLMLTC